MTRPSGIRPHNTENVDPELLAALLEGAGWQQVGGRLGEYTRYAAPAAEQILDGSTRRLLIPLNRRNSDYAELMHDALTQLSDLEVSSPAAVTPVLNRLAAAPGDEVRFKKDVATINGAIPWLTGEELYASARGLLVAGAKSRMTRKAYFGQSNGLFANRFLRAVLMGQTQIGSYVVTAFTPNSQEFPDRIGKDNTNSLTGYTGREIVESMTSGLAATSEAIEHYNSSSSLAAFEDGVRHGISRELTDSLRQMVKNSDGAEVKVEWSITPADLRDTRSMDSSVEFEFDGSVADVLRRASDHLAQTTPAEFVQVIGWPGLLAKPKPGEAGLISLQVRRGSVAPTLKVRLTAEQFEIAASAITNGRGLRISGRQEKEGNRYWLYAVTSLELIDLPEPTTAPPPEQAPGQATLWPDDDLD
ncbi:hypothetical protein OG394_38190 [Kribbella sp. NBC_01245]|uniref:hypothetical protein n=1 Tax=Kribbella sp. NBC_01245 TaxID=2903578 RepID=UPI002E2BF304|nr:hypothetical protein [Kribbella sp. NBC_01245]